MNNLKKINRCSWANASKEEADYHDTRWGVPTYDDRILFKYLVLESMQAGLSWATILKKKKGFIKAFDNFEIKKVASYDEGKINELLNNKDIIRNKLKINGAINNAKVILELQKSGRSFSDYLWAFVDNKPVIGLWEDAAEVPNNTPLSDEITKIMKKDGFKFIGTTIIYSFMQATGMVDDHVKSCFLFKGENLI